MTVTLAKAYTLARFDSLLPGTLFVQPDNSLQTGLRPYQLLAQAPGAEMVKFDEDAAYACTDNTATDPVHTLGFYHFRHDQMVLVGPHISARPDVGGNLEPAAEAKLQTLHHRPGFQMPLSEYYPERWIGRLRLTPNPEYDRAHHLLGELVTHQTVVIAGSMLRLTLTGLSRALQSEYR